jgi:hypothetical protein
VLRGGAGAAPAHEIPVFHDDQHGTAIVAGAALLNGLEVVGKRIEDARIVCSGAGAAAIACLNLVVGLGVRKENIWVTDSKGVVYKGRREYMDDQKARYAQDTPARTLGDIIGGADVFFGLSAAGVLKPEMVGRHGGPADHPGDGQPRPGDPARARQGGAARLHHRHRRSDYPNQVNNVLCFPFIFRGALDVGATTINEEMKLACVRAIAELARADVSTSSPRPTAAGHPLRAGLPDPAAVRPAPDHDRGARGGRGRDGQRGGDPADRRPQGLPGAPAALRLHLRHGDAAGVRGRRRGCHQAHRLRRGRGRPGAARGAGGGGRAPGPAGPGRPARRHPGQDEGPGAAARGRARLRGRGLRRRGE